MKTADSLAGIANSPEWEFTRRHDGATCIFYGRNIMEIFIIDYDTNNDDDWRHEYALIMSSMS
ncbi:hypothetical protein ACERNI_14480 [Camelimonas sp. ID_303_24]